MRRQLIVEELIFACESSLEVIGRDPQPCNVHFWEISYADDLAYPIVAKTPDKLIPMLKKTAGIILTIFSKAGLEVNFGPGKTEAAAVFRGPQAIKARQNMENVKHIPIEAPNGTKELHYAPFHLHIGKKFNIHGTVMPEIVEKSKRINLTECQYFLKI